MFHTHAHPEAVRLVEQNPELKTFVKELNHKFGVSVMSYDKDYHDNCIESFKHLSMDDPIRLRTERSVRIMTARPNGTPFGVIYVDSNTGRSNETKTQYNMISSFIRKERGRGSDQHHRSSINLKMLMKLLESDVRQNDYENFTFKEPLPVVLNFAENSLKEMKNLRYRNGIAFSSSVVLEILQSRFENAELSQRSIDEMDTAYKTYLKEKAATAEMQEVFGRLFTEVYMLVQYRFLPAVVAKVTLKREGTSSNPTTSFSFHPDVKCFSTMDQLSAEYPDLAVSMKMFNTKHNFNNERSDMYEISHHKFYRKDKYDIDLDFVQYYSNINYYGRFDKVDVIIVPVMKHE